MGKTKTGRSKKSFVSSKCDLPNDLPDIKTAPGTILDLPIELLGLIFRKYLTTSDRKILRLVNSYLQIFIDENIGFDVKVDENDSKAKFKFLSEVVLRSISFYNLTQLKRPKAVIIPTFLEMFSYPQCLREVHIELELNAGIFNSIVRNCPALESFSSSLVSSIHSDSSQTSTNQVILPEVDLHTMEPYKDRYLSKLQTMRMMFKETTDLVQGRLSCEAVLALMKSVRSASLDCVILQLNMCDKFSIAEATYAAAVCLDRNPNITKFFFGMLNQVEGRRVEDSSETLEKKSIELFQRAGKNTKISRCGIGTEGNYAFNLWKKFFNSCANLVHMSFTLTSQNGPFTREWFNNSKDTLQQFIYRGDFSHPFNFECIQDCQNLREICLHNLRVDDETTQVVADDIQNLHLIPKSVRSLILFQTVCRTDEIIGVVNRLKDLETLALYKLGHSGEAGINIACIRSILKLRKLKSLLLLRFVASNTVEADELVQILQLMGTVTQEDPPIQEIVVNDTDSSDEDDFVPVINNNFRRLQRSNFHQLRQQFNDRLRLLVDRESGSSSDEWDDEDEDDEWDAYSESETSEIAAEQVRSAIVKDQLAAAAVDHQQSNAPKANSSSVPIVAGDQIDENRNACETKDGSEEMSEVPTGLDGQVDEELLGACGGARRSRRADLLATLRDMENNMPAIRSSTVLGLAGSGQLEIAAPNVAADLPRVPEPRRPLEPIEENPTEPDPEGHTESSDPIIIIPDEALLPLEPDRPNEHERALEEEVDEAVAALDQFIDENRHNFQLMVNLQNGNDLRDILDVLQPVQAEDNNILFGFILEAVIDITDDDTSSSTPNEYGKWKATMNGETGDLSYELKLNCFPI